VSLVAAGERGELEEFLEEIRADGDACIRVRDLSVSWTGATQEWQGFEIRR